MSQTEYTTQKDLYQQRPLSAHSLQQTPPYYHPRQSLALYTPQQPPAAYPPRQSLPAHSPRPITRRDLSRSSAISPIPQNNIIIIDDPCYIGPYNSGFISQPLDDSCCCCDDGCCDDGCCDDGCCDGLAC